MDILTQGLLGAITFAAVKDKNIGKKALLIGAAAGILPDLDFLLAPFFNDIEYLSVHRSVSHSIGLAIGLSLLLGEVFYRVYQKKQSRIRWIFAFFLSIITHSLLDWCTTYGTKLLSPFSAHLFSTNNIHTFEPIYTLILLIGVLLLMFKQRPQIKRRKIAHLTLALSTTYILWTFASKGIANYQFVSALNNQNIAYQKLMVSPTPLNSILWHGIAKTPKGYYFATYSLLDKRDQIEFQYEESYNEVIQKIEKNRLVKYYLDYTQDFPLIKTDLNGNIKIYAIKFGPINYFGVPEFVYPLSFNEHTFGDGNIVIDYSGKQRGPIKNYRNLLKRINGI